MNIDYEAIAVQAGQSTNSLPLGVKQTKAIIEAYEAQKARPEWVPLDLSTVKQGQGVRNMHWPQNPENRPQKFVAVYEGDLVLEHEGFLSKYGHRKPEEWLMRVPKPKTVRVQIFKSSIDSLYMSRVDPSFTPTFGLECVGEGEIEVKA